MSSCWTCFHVRVHRPLGGQGEELRVELGARLEEGEDVGVEVVDVASRRNAEREEPLGESSKNVQKMKIMFKK